LRDYFCNHIVCLLIYYFVCVGIILYIIFSRTFEKNVSKEIGLKLVIFVLSPFLYNGFISESFHHEGKIPEENDLLHMYVKGDTMKGLLT
jgi:multisubunit Na+/H+ antiporter MnhG subunit